MYWLRCTAMALILAPTSLVLGSVQSAADEIPHLAGCFEVSYSFVEDGTSDIFSGLATVAKEWVGFERTGENNFLLQHMLFGGSDFFPHWYETWRWNANTQGWTQEVWGGAPAPDAELRYSCTAPWAMNRWECHAERSKKPIRDENRDYEWLDRENVILVTPNGWVQSEHNGKMDSSGQPLSYELGWIVYRRIDEQQCGTAPDQFPRESQTNR